MKFWLSRRNFHYERLKFDCQMSTNYKKNIRFFKNKFFVEKNLWTRKWSFDNTVRKKLDKRPIFLPHVPTWYKNRFFPKTSFSQWNVLWAHRMQFWQLGHFFEENQYVMFNLRRWENRKKQKWSFLTKGNFPQNVSGDEDCTFDKPNKKNSTRRPVVPAQCPKMQNVNKRIYKFFRSLFPTKSSDKQVETSTDYPAGKVSFKGQKFVAEPSTLMKKLKIFPSFCFHQLFLWTRENEVLTTRPSLSSPRLNFFCQRSESQMNICKFFFKKHHQNGPMDR